MIYFLNNKQHFIFVFILGIIFFNFASADSSSTDFKLENPVNITGGGQASSPSFQYFGSTGQLTNGQSVSTDFTQNAGPLYFPAATSPIVSATVGDSRVILNWTSAEGVFANIVSYEVGVSTASGGTFTYTTVGNVLTSIRTGLMNGVTYFFKVRSRVAGLVLSESAEVNATPTIPIQVTSSTTVDSISPTQIISESLNSSEGTTAVVSIPANTLAGSDTYKISLYSFPKTEVSATLPVPSGKVAAGTIYNFSVYKESDLTQVSSFTQPVTVSISYTDADVSGLTESSLVLSSWDGSQWSALSNQVLDAAHNTVSGTTTHFSNFAILGNPVASTSTPSTSSGGGGGDYTAPTSNATTFSGRAYPNSTVTLLKDAQVLVSTEAGGDANFSINVNDLATGNYVFGIYSEDNNGNRSSLLTFPVSLTAGASTNIGGIFLAPTISADKSQVKKGDNITFFGQSTPVSQVTIAINSQQEIFKTVNSDKNGVYLQVVDSSELDLGDHTAKSKVAKDGLISPYGKIVAFSVGDSSVDRKNETVAYSKADLNNDGKTNLIDFSIEAYWYKKSLPPVSLDLNGDGKIDLIDFSIMASNWTD